MIIAPSDLAEKFNKLRKGEFNKRGLSTGFLALDEYLKIAKGFLMIISGYPGGGKSEWLDSVLVNMTLLYDWNIIYYSPENHPTEQHMSKIAEKYIGKHITNFDDYDNNHALEYMEKHFRWVYPEDPKLDTLLAFAHQAHKEKPVDCLVLDPWNAISHNRSGEMIHEYLSDALSRVIRFSRNNNILVAIVAHPTKPQKDRDGNIPVPTLYDVSDGAHWRNKADIGIICHRPDMSKNEIQIYMNKLKNKWMGKVGMVELDYNYTNGRFKCKNEKEFLLPTDIESPF